MNFKKLTPQDITTVLLYFALAKSRICDFTPGTAIMWSDYYNTEYCIDQNIMFCRQTNEKGELFYMLPFSDDIENAIKICISRFSDKQGKIRFSAIPEEYTALFTKLYPDCTVTQLTDYSDYLYNSEDLIHLKGKKYSAQRNLISQFKRNHAVWSFEDISKYPYEETSSAFTAFAKNTGSDTVSAENIMTSEVLKNPSLYNMQGGVLTADGKIVGFSLGEVMGDTLFTHIEKADRNTKGAYQMLVNCFSEKFGTGTTFINREEDMGDEGLRRAKEAYHPTMYLSKYMIKIG